jgi:acetolactate synthase-1/2/3 large subunit
MPQCCDARAREPEHPDLVLANRSYQILRNEMQNVGATNIGRSRRPADIGNPDIDWRSLAKGFGVEALRAETMDELSARSTLATRQGPCVIEIVPSFARRDHT